MNKVYISETIPEKTINKLSDNLYEENPASIEDIIRNLQRQSVHIEESFCVSMNDHKVFFEKGNVYAALNPDKNWRTALSIASMASVAYFSP